MVKTGAQFNSTTYARDHRENFQSDYRFGRNESGSGTRDRSVGESKRSCATNETEIESVCVSYGCKRRRTQARESHALCSFRSRIC